MYKNRKKVINNIIHEIIWSDSGRFVVVYMPYSVSERCEQELRDRKLDDLYPIKFCYSDDSDEVLWCKMQNGYGNRVTLWCESPKALQNVLSFFSGNLITTRRMYSNFLRYLTLNKEDIVRCDYLPTDSCIVYMP